LIRTVTKISLFLVVTALFVSCDAVKRLSDDQLLLSQNTILLDGEETNENGPKSQLNQKPNSKVLGIPFGLHIYNLADPMPDSTYSKWLYKKPKRKERLVRFLSEKQVEKLGRSYVGFNRWIEDSGQAPIIIDESKAQKSANRLFEYYFKKGWFNTKTSFKIEKDSNKNKRGSITYKVDRFKPYVIDSISEKITSPVVDSLFQKTKDQTFIVAGKQYAATDFENERDRLTIQFRNSGLYYFDQDYIGFDADTNSTGHKVNVTYDIGDRKITIGDSTRTSAFKVHTINDVLIVTDYLYDNRNKKFKDSVKYEGYTLYSYEDMKFNPKAITDAVAIAPNKIFKDIDRTLTYNQLSDLRIFKYPNISYQEDPRDSTGTGLIATILLSPQKKYNFSVDFDAYTSTIQQFGIGFSSTFTIRNLFKGAETLEVSGRGSIGSSNDAADSESTFFNVSDVGGDVKLSFPRILFPLNTDRIIPKYMSPFTSVSIGANAQNNIGLDRQNINAVFSYQWRPSNLKNYRIELFNVQYVRNLNTNNYFNVYQNSYDRLNEIAVANNYDFEDNDPNNQQLGIPNETDTFISQALDGNNPLLLSNADRTEVQSIDQRKDRLTEDNLIFATSFNWLRDTRQGLGDKSFSKLRWKAETAGNLLSNISGIANLKENENGDNEILGVVFSQYAKGEIEYIKHWQLSGENIIAIRSFGGLAIPYGNSNSIPFTRSYFAGGANDNRGWRAYDLGPGSSGGVLDFNEANLKLAFNAEYRYKLFGSFKGAFFVDAGNIWNVLDDVEDEAFTFDGAQDLQELAVATGFGLRYDFAFFVIRFDVGFKTHDPARPQGARWFKDYNFGNAVYNIGINYPF